MGNKSHEVLKSVLMFTMYRLMDIESLMWTIADITIFPIAWLRRYLAFTISNLK